MDSRPQVNGFLCYTLRLCVQLTVFHFTVKSFVELGQFLLSVPGVSCFLSERLCQDPLKSSSGASVNGVGQAKTLVWQNFVLILKLYGLSTLLVLMLHEATVVAMSRNG